MQLKMYYLPNPKPDVNDAINAKQQAMSELGLEPDNRYLYTISTDEFGNNVVDSAPNSPSDAMERLSLIQNKTIQILQSQGYNV